MTRTPDCAAGGGELRRVLEQLDHRPLQAARVAPRGERAARKVLDQRELPSAKRSATWARARRVVSRKSYSECMKRILAGLDAGDVEEVVDERAEPADAVLHRAERLLLRLVERAQLLVGEQLHVPDDRGHRGRELVGDVAVELGARGVELAEPGVGARELGHLLLQVGDDALALLAQPARPLGRGATLLARAAEVAGDDRREGARVDRLLEEAVAADGEARLAIALGGDRHDGHAGERRLAAQAQGDLESVEAGDVEVDEDEVGLLRTGETYPFEAVGGVDHLVPSVLEELADEQPVRADRPRCGGCGHRSRRSAVSRFQRLASANMSTLVNTYVASVLRAARDLAEPFDGRVLVRTCDRPPRR